MSVGVVLVPNAWYWYDRPREEVVERVTDGNQYHILHYGLVRTDADGKLVRFKRYD